MATSGYSFPVDGTSGGYRPIPSIVYVCEEDSATAEQLADLCLTHAAQRAWRVVETVIEETPHAPLDKRKGWKRVRTALAEGFARIVITSKPTAVAPGLADFQVMQAEFRTDGAVLVAATGVPDPPSRHGLAG